VAKVDFQPQRPHELLAVFPDKQTADRVIIDLRENAHVTAHAGTNRDEQHSLNAEMAEEIEESWVSPQAGFLYPKEGARFGAWIAPLCIIGGILVTLPITFLWTMTNAARIATGVGVGAAMGATVVLILMSLGQKRPSEPMAAEEGVVVRVSADREDVRQMLLAAHPLRLDVVDDQGRPIETIATEGDSSSPKETGKRMNEWP
jgi:hypothetical protein